MPSGAERSSRETWALCVVLGLTLFGMVFVLSAGFAHTWPSLSHYYDLQAQGFARGQLAIALEPRPQLLAAPNPFDVSVGRLWEWDLSLYQGRYHLYWGPVPALLLLPLKLVGVQTVVGDEWLSFAAMVLHVLTGAWLMRAIVRRFFVGVPTWLLVLGVGVFAWGNPLPWMLADGAIYQTAILWGQAWLLLGVAFVFKALDGRAVTGLAVAAASSWGLALGARLSLAPAVALLAAGALWLLWAKRQLTLQRFVGVVAPLLLCGLALMAFNNERFGSPYETGVSYQLAFVKFRLNLESVPANIYSYLVRLPELHCVFPFISQPVLSPEQTLPALLIPALPYWTVEPVTGVLWGLPLVWLAPLGMVGVWRRSEPEARWLLGSLLALAVATVLVPSGLFIATMRYLVDGRSGVVLLAFLGACVLWQRAASSSLTRRLASALIGTLLLLSIAIGALLATQGYRNLLQTKNPLLFALLSQLRVCSPEHPH